jgi:hypothetical protein
MSELMRLSFFGSLWNAQLAASAKHRGLGAQLEEIAFRTMVR